MAEHKSLHSISHDHFHGMMVAQIIRKDSSVANDFLRNIDDKVNYSIHFFDQELVNHFYLEEQILLPLLKGISKEIDEISNRLVDEHNFLSELFDELKFKTDLENKLDRISKVLEAHIQFEEKVFFPKIQETLSKEELAALARKLHDNGYENIYKY
ncbi:MAG: hemerythrin domain-containing protein [Ignavibacteriaceae bacterium]